jgi:hypothetical protein
VSEQQPEAAGQNTGFSQAELIKGMMHPIEWSDLPPKSEVLIPENEAQQVSGRAIQMASERFAEHSRVMTENIAGTEVHELALDRDMDMSLFADGMEKISGATMRLERPVDAPDEAAPVVVLDVTTGGSDRIRTIFREGQLPEAVTYPLEEAKQREAEAEDLTGLWLANTTAVLDTFQAVLNEQAKMDRIKRGYHNRENHG